MRSRKRRDIKILILVLLLCFGIGFAFLRTNLEINGVVNTPNASWDIHFNNVQITAGSVELSTGDVAAGIVTGQTNQVAYKVSFHNPGDYYEFTVDVVNAGTIDAMIDTISSKLNNAELTSSNLPAYLKYKVTYADGIQLAAKHKLEAGHTEKYKVRIEYRSDVDASELPKGETLTFNFQVDYVQANSTAIDKPSLIQLPNGRTKDNLQVGDEICINGPTTECFNFIRYDEDENIVMLSKWNLNVGSNAKGEATNLQDSDVRGDVSSGIRYGMVAFSGTKYWADGNNLKSKYGSAWDANNIYDIDYSDATGTDYSLAYYVESYKNTLESYGLIVNDARLLTYSEATDSSIGCDVTNHSCPTSGFITNTSFWLGSARGYAYVWILNSSGYFSDNDFDVSGRFGVRPVIVISKSDI